MPVQVLPPPQQAWDFQQNLNQTINNLGQFFLQSAALRQQIKNEEMMNQYRQQQMAAGRQRIQWEQKKFAQQQQDRFIGRSPGEVQALEAQGYLPAGTSAKLPNPAQSQAARTAIAKENFFNSLPSATASLSDNQARTALSLGIPLENREGKIYVQDVLPPTAEPAGLSTYEKERNAILEGARRGDFPPEELSTRLKSIVPGKTPAELQEEEAKRQEADRDRQFKLEHDGLTPHAFALIEGREAPPITPKDMLDIRTEYQGASAQVLSAGQFQKDINELYPNPNAAQRAEYVLPAEQAVRDAISNRNIAKTRYANMVADRLARALKFQIDKPELTDAAKIKIIQNKVEADPDCKNNPEIKESVYQSLVDFSNALEVRQPTNNKKAYASPWNPAGFGPNSKETVEQFLNPQY